MAKELLKKRIRERQDGIDALRNVVLPPESELWDTDRIVQKKDGGVYDDDLKNVRGLDPVSHMEHHGTLRRRRKEYHQLKIIIDGREQVRKLVNSFGNRLLALKRKTDDLDEITKQWLDSQLLETKKFLTTVDKRVVKHLKLMKHPIIKSALGVRGIGPVTVAYMLIYIDIKKAEYAGNLWSYVGIVKHSYERYEKGVSGGGNKTLRTALYAMAASMIRTRSPYRDVYDLEKLKLSKSRKLVQSRNTKGKLIECMWKDTKPGHRHGAGIRKIIKHFLADWWFVHRTLEGLPIVQSYVIEYLGHKNWIKPEERWWK